MSFRMIRITALSLSLLALPVQARAAVRTFTVGSFERVRVDGPFRVVLTLGVSPGARAEGDQRVVDTVDVRVEGTTLIVRAGNSGWGETPEGARREAPVIRISTLAVRAITIVGAAQVAVGGPFRGQQIDLSLTGSGTLDAPTIAADRLAATVLGSGTMILGGRTAKARLSTSGTASIAATRLDAGDLTVRLDGNGEIVGHARYTASVLTTGLGSVTVYGKPACTVNAVAGGPVNCGKGEAPAPGEGGH